MKEEYWGIKCEEWIIKNGERDLCGKKCNYKTENGSNHTKYLCEEHAINGFRQPSNGYELTRLREPWEKKE